jgi:zinc D-Ala-D-Ala dipeptidase
VTVGFAPAERWRVPIEECGEPLLPLSEISELVTVAPVVPARIEYLAGRDLWARERVVGMLALLAAGLAGEYRLVVVDAYRSLAYQRLRFEGLLEATRRRFPGEREDSLMARVDALVAIPETDLGKPPPHSTGGAIDMMLIHGDSRAIDYGSRISSFGDPLEDARHATDAEGLSPAEREARLRLLRAAQEVGFANHPAEWWHFMFGDQEHALATGVPTAVYGRADLVPGEHTG